MSNLPSMTPALSTPGMMIAGKYRLERKLGQGGMGVVWLARVEGQPHPVAVKLLDLSGVDRREALERFHREALAPAKINHPGIIEVLDIGTEQGMPFLVMEYLQGFTLAELGRDGALPPRVVSAVMAPVLDALAAAHQAGILHRDLKPQNVMLIHSPTRRVKLLDFGVARFTAALKPLTQTGAAIGTPNYMSPEQVLGKKELTRATDLYSVGVMLFELLTGRRLFKQDSLMSLLTAVVKEPAPPIATLVPDLPPAFCVLVDSLLAKDPWQRPSDARAVREKLTAMIPPDQAALWSLAFPEQSVERREGSTQVRVHVPEKKRPPPWRWIAVGAALVCGAGMLAAAWKAEHERAKSEVRQAAKPSPLVRPPPLPTRVSAPEPASAPIEPAPAPRPCSEQLLAHARQNLQQGDLASASADLATCRENPGNLARSAMLLESRLKDEVQSKTQLDNAEKALARGDLTAAAGSLFNALPVRTFRERHGALEERARSAGAPLRDSFVMRQAAKNHAADAEASLRRRDFAAAQGHATGCQLTDPAFATCYRLLGMALAAQGQTEEAARNYQRYVDLADKGGGKVKFARKALADFLAGPP